MQKTVCEHLPPAPRKLRQKLHQLKKLTLGVLYFNKLEGVRAAYSSSSSSSSSSSEAIAACCARISGRTDWKLLPALYVFMNQSSLHSVKTVSKKTAPATQVRPNLAAPPVPLKPEKRRRPGIRRADITISVRQSKSDSK